MAAPAPFAPSPLPRRAATCARADRPRPRGRRSRRGEYRLLRAQVAAAVGANRAAPWWGEGEGAAARAAARALSRGAKRGWAGASAAGGAEGGAPGAPPLEPFGGGAREPSAQMAPRPSAWGIMSPAPRRRGAGGAGRRGAAGAAFPEAGRRDRSQMSNAELEAEGALMRAGEAGGEDRSWADAMEEEEAVPGFRGWPAVPPSPPPPPPSY